MYAGFRISHMKKLLKHKKTLLIICDVLLIPGLLFCRWLSAEMLANYSVCSWMLLGGKCVTCGGTHFVYALLRGRIAEAFAHNPFLFLLAIFALLSYVLLHISWLADSSPVKKLLKKLYSFHALLVFLGIMLLFFLGRNIPLFIRLYEILSQ